MKQRFDLETIAKIGGFAAGGITSFALGATIGNALKDEPMPMRVLGIIGAFFTGAFVGNGVTIMMQEAILELSSEEIEETTKFGPENMFE